MGFLPGGPVVKTCTSNAGTASSMGEIIPHASQPKKQTNGSNIVTNSVKTLEWSTSTKSYKTSA